LGGENGIEVDGAENVVLERVRVAGSQLDGIHVRRGQVTIRDCIVQLAGPYRQGIDISFAFDLGESIVEGCTIVGGQEGIVGNSARVMIRDNLVTKTTLRGISVNEMSMGSVEGNTVEDTLGVGIFCSDYSHCLISSNSIAHTRADRASGDGMRMGYAIVAHFRAKATLDENELRENHRNAAAFADAVIIE
jgi:parallel beta-helix repeat protein